MSRRFLTPAQCDRLRRLCQVHSLRTAAAIVGCSPGTVSRLQARGWRPAHGGQAERPRPGDFAIQCGDMTIKELCAHYRAGDAVVRRWAAEVGRVFAKPRRIYAPMPLPDGSAAAIAYWGERGTGGALDAALAEHGASRAAEVYGVCYGTLKIWRRKLGMPLGWSRQRGRKRDRTPAPPSQFGWADGYRSEARR